MASVTHPAGASPLSAVETVTLPADGGHIDLTARSWVLSDPTRAEAAADALAAPGWRPVDTAVIDFGFTDAQLFVLTVVENAGGPARWLLSPELVLAERLTVFRVTPDGAAPIFESRLSDPFDGRAVAHRSLVVPLDLDAGERVGLLIAYTSDRTTQMPLFIEDPATFSERVRGEDASAFAVGGAVLAMAVISTVYIASLGMAAAWYYGAYLLLALLYMATADGFAFHYLWPNAPGWNALALVPIGMATAAAAALFARAFVCVGGAPVWLSRLLLGAAALLVVVMVASPVFFDAAWFKTATAAIVGLGSVLPLVSALVALRAKVPGAALFCVGATAITLTVLALSVGYLNPGLFDQDHVGVMARGALLIEGLTFALAIFRHAVRVREERTRALQAEVALSREKFTLSEALRAAERDHRSALEAVDEERQRTASTAHDIRQPLASLRAALLTLDHRPDVAERLSMSFDYLDGIITDTMARHPAAEPGAPAETFGAGLVISNVATMFGQEAAGAEKSLRTVPSARTVHAEPLALMRCVSNCVANALAHGGDTVLVGCRARAGAVAFEIHDDGPGMDAAALETVRQAGVRGAGSAGAGLGLSIVEETCREAGFSFTLRSHVGRGTVATITVPPPGLAR
ncbi:MAG: 7TM diverse intracellular signaling domain-containing protein [Pseudomonadota bacterium]